LVVTTALNAQRQTSSWTEVQERPVSGSVPGAQDLAQDLAVAGHAELLADDLDDFFRALLRQGTARRRLVGGQAVGGRVDQVSDQAGPQRVKGRRHAGTQERDRLAGGQVFAQSV
jgi:hypothetical protein